MFEALEREVEGLEVPVDGPLLVELLALRDRLDARVTAAVGEYDASGLWEVEGFTSMASWLRTRAKATPGDARRTTTTAALVRRCPALRVAWEDGELSSGQVAVVSANVSERAADLFEEHAPEVVPLVVGLDLRDTTTVMRSWAQAADDALGGPDPEDDPVGKAHLSCLLEGRARMDVTFDRDAHALVLAALRTAESRDAEGEERTPAQRRHDALLDVCRHFLDHQTSRIGGRHRPHLNAVIDVAELVDGKAGRTLEGIPLSAAELQRIACDCNVHRVIRDGRSSILDYGRATRTIPPAVYTALVLRDLGCRFPGCDRPGSWCDGHHVRPWQVGGRTDLSNLVLLCSRHHHLIHEKGWELKLLPSATVEVTDPQGRVHTSDPPLLR